VKKYNKLMIFT